MADPVPCRTPDCPRPARPGRRECGTCQVRRSRATRLANGCPCWHAPVSLHDGHCCFRHPTHDYRSDVPLPCGHDHREESHA